MDKNKFLKGFEIELFTGTYDAHIGISDEIDKMFSDFVKEPDNRNVEYITEPNKDYEILYESLLNPRIRLRRWLKERGLTIIPSSTLCFHHDIRFQRSEQNNSYHEFIESCYGTSIATSSVHINLGIDDLDKLFAAIRLVRCEASLYLALSASSPFINGRFSGNHSQRWIQFPKTPALVPFFKNHEEYINWIENKINIGEMQNIRHFWSSIRPNGPQRPYKLDRLELRICDFVQDIKLLLAITAFLELRVIFLFENMKTIDPLNCSYYKLEELSAICDLNEFKVAQNSLNAELVNWKNGKKILCSDWIRSILDQLSPLAQKFDMKNYLKPIYKVLQEGNKSMQWIKKYSDGLNVEEIMKMEIDRMINNEEDVIMD